jgi:hypothetical protein
VMIVSRYLPILDHLQKLEKTASAKGKIDAGALYYNMCGVHFVATLLLFCDIMAIIDPLCRHLQDQELDVSAIDYIEGAVQRVRLRKTHPGHYEQRREVLTESIRQAGHELRSKKGNFTLASTIQWWKNEVRDSMIENVALSIEGRFPQEQQKLLQAFNSMFSPAKYPASVESDDFEQWGIESLTLLISHVQKAREKTENLAAAEARQSWEDDSKQQVNGEETKELKERIAKAKHKAAALALPRLPLTADEELTAVDLSVLVAEWRSLRVYIRKSTDKLTRLKVRSCCLSRIVVRY